MIKKCMVVGVICLLMMVAIPLVNAEYDYPKDEGPYTVFIDGECDGGAIPSLFTFSIKYFFRYGFLPGMQIGPFNYWLWPEGPSYHMREGSIFIVNGEVQDVEYPVQFQLRGFKGYAPASPLWFTKAMLNGKIRIFGVCEEIGLLYF